MPTNFSRVATIGVLSIHVALLTASAVVHSPTFNELGHVPAGISHWRYGKFELYRVNPPLPRMVATFPLLFVDVKTDWTEYSSDALARDELQIGIRFAKVNRARTFWLFTLARFPMIGFSIIGALVCQAWAKELWGGAAGSLALVLWCFNPTILGHAPLVMPDVPGAVMGVAACFVFWRWLRAPSWDAAFIAGAVLGLALLCKTTLLIFFGLWPALVAIHLSSGVATHSVRRLTPMLLVIFVIGTFVVNLGYGFVGAFSRLDSFRFVSTALSGRAMPEEVGNRFEKSALGLIRSPFPCDYLQGIDRQRADFESGERSYLRGKWSDRGWWYYHVYALGIKTPLGTWLLAIAAVISVLVSQAYRGHLIDELCTLLPIISLIALISSQTGFSNHSRYSIPALPFIFISTSRVAIAIRRRNLGLIAMGMAGVVWSTASSLMVYPHSISYFNEAIGPVDGHWHLLDSNIAWGQDILFLRDWIDRHPEASQIEVAAFGWINPRLAGIKTKLPPLGPNSASATEMSLLQATDIGPRPGWYAIDVNFLHGTHWPAQNGAGTWTSIPTAADNYEYFLRFEPMDRIGYSMHIYHITLEDANRVRSDLNLPILEAR